MDNRCLAGVDGYIVSPKGGLYAISETDSTDQQLLRMFGSSAFNHSLIRAGEPVQAGGGIQHTKKTPDHLHQLLKRPL